MDAKHISSAKDMVKDASFSIMFLFNSKLTVNGKPKCDIIIPKEILNDMPLKTILENIKNVRPYLDKFISDIEKQTA